MKDNRDIVEVITVNGGTVAVIGVVDLTHWLQMLLVAASLGYTLWKWHLERKRRR